MGDNTLLLVLLVTPPLLGILEEDSSFFVNIFGRLFPKLEVGREFDVLAAVVDSIPHVPAQYLKAVEANIPSNVHLGFDGISLLLCDSQATAPDLWSPRQESHERDSMDIQQRATISFLYGPPERWRTWAAARTTPRVYTTQSLELPLANTMFYNAQTSTMFAQRWTVVRNGEDNPMFDLIKQTPLTQQTLDMAKHVGEGDLDVFLPLIPITVPRRITAAMGNIIRRIQTGDSPEDQAPASEELEKDIHSYFEGLGSAEERVGIWALVTPQEIWIGQPQSTREKILFSDIENGARLHKVLSGGGGWGAKQGLLSLDPHSTYSRSEQASQLLISDDADLEAEKQALLGQLVKPGDVVQFFLHRPSVRNTQSEPQELSHTQSLFDPANGPRTTIFGTIPSTMDAMPQSSHSPAIHRPSSIHTLIHTHFGALSEQGISVTLTTHNTHAPASSAPVGAQRVGPVVTTKLDVPHARFAWVPTGATWNKNLTALQSLAQAKRAQGRIRRVALDEGEEQNRERAGARFWMVPRLPARDGGAEESAIKEAPPVVPKDWQGGFRLLKIDTEIHERRPRTEAEIKRWEDERKERKRWRERGNGVEGRGEWVDIEEVKEMEKEMEKAVGVGMGVEMEKKEKMEMEVEKRIKMKMEMEKRMSLVKKEGKWKGKSWKKREGRDKESRREGEGEWD